MLDASTKDKAAGSLELRAAKDLAALWLRQGRRQEALAFLAPIHAWFSEGFGTRDLKEAKTLLDQLQAWSGPGLTRSLADFVNLIELFDAHDVSFVSVTQSFNISSSMGRLTLNVLLSFAQFERRPIGAGGGKERADLARYPWPHTRSLCAQSPAQTEQWCCWISRRRIIFGSAEIAAIRAPS
jgi:hypothetical protein